MANAIGSRQWRLDTPRVFGTPGSVLWNSNLAMVQAEFSGGTRCILKDSNGRTVWDVTTTATMPVRLGNIGWVDGLCLDTLDAGVCVVYIR